jgi:hypothetical protein
LTKQYFGEFPNQGMGYASSFNAAGTRLAIGSYSTAYTTSASFSQAGVYIYDYDASLNKWSDAYSAKFTINPIDTSANAYTSFGSAVSLNAAGDRLAIGAYNATPGGNATYYGRGAVYIYHYNYSTQRWPTTATFTYYDTSIPTTSSFQFGWTLNFNARGDRLAVSARNGATTTAFGYIYVFHYNYATNSWPGTSGTLSAKNSAAIVYVGNVGQDNIGGGFQFGFNAAGDRLAIGTYNFNRTLDGALYLIHYDYQKEQWPAEAAYSGTSPPVNINFVTSYTMKYNDTNINNQFGYACTFNAAGDKVAVASNPLGLYSLIYIIEYNYITNSWPTSGAANISAATGPFPYSAYYTGTTLYLFGSSLKFSASGNRLMIGGQSLLPIYSGVGTLYVMDRNPVTGWPAVDTQNTPNYITTLPTSTATASAYPFRTVEQATYTIASSDPSTYYNNEFVCAMNDDGTRIAFGNAVSGLFGTGRGYVNIYDLSTPLQLQSSLALTTSANTAAITLAAGSGISTVLAASPNGLSWNNIADDRAILYNGGDGRTLVQTQALTTPAVDTGIVPNEGLGYGDRLVMNQAGTRLAVAAPLYPYSGSTSYKGSVYIYTSTNLTGWQNIQTLNNPIPYNGSNSGTSGGGGKYFGNAMCMNPSGSKLLISMVVSSTSTFGDGTTYSGDVFSYNYVNGQYVLDINPKFPHTYVRSDGYGGGSWDPPPNNSLAVNDAGTKAVVGAASVSNTPGAVYCYNYDAQRGWLLDTITPILHAQPSPTQSARFGTSVALNSAGTILLVGEPNYSFSASDISGGKVYCYNYGSLGGWQKVQDLSGGFGALDTNQRFGSALAMNSEGSRLVVGAPFSSGVGKVYSYTYGSNGLWILDTSFNGYQVGEQFGTTLALNAAGDRLSVGAPLSPLPSNTNGGKVYNYVYATATKWQKTFELTGSVGGGLASNGGGLYYGFGGSLALNGAGNRLIVGDPRYQNYYNSVTYSDGGGIVYSYDEPFATRQCNAIASNSSVVVAGGQSIRNPLAYSLDGGQTWAESVNGGTLFAGADVSANSWGLRMNVSYNQCNAVAWNGSIWVAGGLGPQALAYSYDGLTWLPSTFTGFSVCNAVVWNGLMWLASGQALQVQVEVQGQVEVQALQVQVQATSTDGITWSVNPAGAALGTALAARDVPVEGNPFAVSTQIAIGNNAGGLNQGSGAIALGQSAGQTSQQNNAVAIGAFAGLTSQSVNSVAIGAFAGQTSQGINAVAVGIQAGKFNQGTYSVALGCAAGQTNQQGISIAIGYRAGTNTQKGASIAIGVQAGETTQGAECIAIGVGAAQTNQGDESIAIGRFAGYSQQKSYALAIGYNAGSTNQTDNAIAIGRNAGYNTQGNASIAIGLNAGNVTQQTNAVAIGCNAGYTNQGTNSVAIGTDAAITGQESGAVAIGNLAGRTSQRANAVAIGCNAGYTNQGTNAVAIGNNAGVNNQAANSICINARGTGLENTTANSCVIAPIRNAAGTGGIVEYTTTNGEVTYNSGNTVATLKSATTTAQTAANSAQTAANNAQTAANNAQTAANNAQNTANSCVFRSYQNYSGSRSVGTWYTAPNYPIMITLHISGYGSGVYGATLLFDDGQLDYPYNNVYFTLTAVIPANKRYKVVGLYNIANPPIVFLYDVYGNLNYWYETR